MDTGLPQPREVFRHPPSSSVLTLDLAELDSSRYDPRLAGTSAFPGSEGKYCVCFRPIPQDTVYESLSLSANSRHTQAPKN